MPEHPEPAARPRFSIVSAVYNVAPYLREYIDSIESQTFDLARVEVIVIDDGSTDESLTMLQEWRRRRPDLVTVLTKANGGQASARNLGIEHARGEWITFTDPDDAIDPRYLTEVDKSLRSNNDSLVLVATNRIVFNDVTREMSKHALYRHFTKRNRVRNLDYDTAHFHGHAPCAFFCLDVLKRDGLRFDERVRPTFEDGHFCCAYLLRAPEPLVAYLATARYYYRKRGDASSTLDRSWTDPRRFTDVLEYGYLALLRESIERSGRPPTWLQGMIIYELSWYFRTADRISPQTAGHGETLDRFHELFPQILQLLDPAGIDGYSATRLKPVWREILRHGYRDEQWHTPFAIVDKVDTRQDMLRLSYRFTGDLPEETFVVYGKPVSPVHQKICDLRFFDRSPLHERIVWLPFGTVRVVLDGRDVDVRLSEPEPATHFLESGTIRARLDRTTTIPEAGAAKTRRPPLADRAVQRLARTRLVRHFFGDAWVLMDRIFNANDSAEHLFRYLRTHRRRINAWFVVQRDTPEYRSLRADGFRRVIPHGSLAWKLLMLNCQHLISTHADHPIVRPAQITRLITPAWRFTFLQHGVIKDDISNWLNLKDIDIFLTSTPQEQESIAGDHTAYKCTTREAKLTGLPRFDAILRQGERFPPDKRDLILIAPTWRQWLSSANEVSRHSVTAAFRESDFAVQWTAFLNSPALRTLAERAGLTVALLMHPNFQDTATLETLPHVRSFAFDGENVQELFARARVLVTDYSSMAFNVAYIERPIVYFQFDRDAMFAGGHVGRRGYFDYERDGYGPVTFTVDDALAATVEAVQHGPAPAAEYLRRVGASFPQRDGRCCERAADAIAASTKPIDRTKYETTADRQTLVELASLTA